MTYPMRVVIGDDEYVRVIEADCGTSVLMFALLAGEIADAPLDVIPADAVIFEEYPAEGGGVIRVYWLPRPLTGAESDYEAPWAYEGQEGTPTAL